MACSYVVIGASHAERPSSHRGPVPHRQSTLRPHSKALADRSDMAGVGRRGGGGLAAGAEGPPLDGPQPLNESTQSPQSSRSSPSTYSALTYRSSYRCQAPCDYTVSGTVEGGTDQPPLVTHRCQAPWKELTARRALCSLAGSSTRQPLTADRERTRR